MLRSARLSLKVSIFLACVLPGQGISLAGLENNDNFIEKPFQGTQGILLHARGLEEQPPTAQPAPEVTIQPTDLLPAQKEENKSPTLQPGTQPATSSPLRLEENPSANAGTKADPAASKLTSREEQAGKLFELIIQMGINLEVITSLGSNTSEIVQDSTKVMEMVPKIDSLRKNLLAEVPTKTEEITTATEKATKAGEELVASLKAIQQKAEDANLIKEHYKVLENSFKAILQAADGVATAAIPKLAELVAAEKKAAEAAGVVRDGPASKGKEAETGKESAVLKEGGSEAGRRDAGSKGTGTESEKEGAGSKDKNSDGPKLAVLPKNIIDPKLEADATKPVVTAEAKGPDVGKESAAPKPEEKKPAEAQGGEQNGGEKKQG